MATLDGLARIGITKILVADDRAENIAAAKEYLGKHCPKEITIEYASSAAEAMHKIKAAFAEGDRFKLVVSDLEMEEPESGHKVVRCAIEHLALGFIATGRVATAEQEADGHGSQVSVVPSESGAIKGTKDKPETWGKIFSAAYAHIGCGNEMDMKMKIFRSMERFALYTKMEKMPDSLVRVAMALYKR